MTEETEKIEKAAKTAKAERADSTPSICTVSSREVYRNRWMRVREDEIVRSNGARGIYGVVDKHPCAVVIPLDRIPLEGDALGGDSLGGDALYLVRQFRYTVQQVCMEFPQGGWEREDVDLEELARGELREETGMTAAAMTYLGPMYVAYGFANQMQHAFLATGLTPGSTDFDPEEHDLTLHRVPVAEFEQMLRTGAIRDCCTLAAWGLYKVWNEARIARAEPMRTALAEPMRTALAAPTRTA